MIFAQALLPKLTQCLYHRHFYLANRPLNFLGTESMPLSTGLLKKGERGWKQASTFKMAV